MNIFPDTGTLIHYLSAMLGRREDQIDIICRKHFYESSTFPVEIVSCQIDGGKMIDLFCKYLGGMGPNNNGHRGGVEYEAKIYSDILEKISLSKTKYYGQCQLDNGDTLLVLEYLGENLRMFYSKDPDVLLKAAEWIGSFHKIYEDKAPAFVKRYDQSYYIIWSKHFENSMYAYLNEYAWLKAVINFYNDNVGILTSAQQTIIHGEYYPKNILQKQGTIYPVDWESAAVAPGEIDLASLLEGLDMETAARVKGVYKKARWPLQMDSVNDFEQRLLMAQIYFHFWEWPEMSDKLSITTSEGFKQLYQLFKEVNL